MQELNNSTVTEKAVTAEKQTEKQPAFGGASLEDLGLQVVDNDNIQIALARPVRHIRSSLEV